MKILHFQIIIVLKYGVNRAENTSATAMTPIAQFVLKKAPALYNPLESTFHIRTSHHAMEYTFPTPEIYYDDDNIVRKVLLNKNDKEVFLSHIMASKSELSWLERQLEDLTEENSYISIPPTHRLIYID